MRDKASIDARLGAIVLAAGESRRMGTPKQLLRFAGTSLLRHTCLMALATPASHVVVVLGANHEACAVELADLPVEVTVNLRWSDGMGESLRVGINCLMSYFPRADGVLLLLVDQPMIDTSDFTKLFAAWDPPAKSIAAAAYNGTVGVPAVFARSHFQELVSLSAQSGARALIARHASATATVEMTAAAYDLDTVKDYERFLELSSRTRPATG